MFSSILNWLIHARHRYYLFAQLKQVSKQPFEQLVTSYQKRRCTFSCLRGWYTQWYLGILLNDFQYSNTYNSCLYLKYILTISLLYFKTCLLQIFDKSMTSFPSFHLLIIYFIQSYNKYVQVAEKSYFISCWLVPSCGTTTGL